MAYVENHHVIRQWEETLVLDHCGGQKPVMEEALHIQMTPAEEHFNQKGGLHETPGWLDDSRQQEKNTAFDFQCILNSP